MEFIVEDDLPSERQQEYRWLVVEALEHFYARATDYEKPMIHSLLWDWTKVPTTPEATCERCGTGCEYDPDVCLCSACAALISGS